MLNLLVTLPLQCACQLIGAGNSTIYLDQNVSTAPHQAILPDGYVPFSDVGVAYKYYHSTQTTWNAARKSCMTDGATLAVLDSFEKIGFALSVKKAEAAPHVGIHRSFDKIEWTSVKTSLPVASIPWAPEPALNTLNYDCAVLYPDGRGLAARECSNRRGYICEVSILENNDTSRLMMTLIPN